MRLEQPGSEQRFADIAAHASEKLPEGGSVTYNDNQHAVGPGWFEVRFRVNMLGEPIRSDTVDEKALEEEAQRRVKKTMEEKLWDLQNPGRHMF